MNNLKQKNILYGGDLKDVLPHAGGGESIMLRQNSNITDIRINNAMQQLVNNDLYLENKIAAGLGYQPGPEGYQAESAVSALPDGSKRWVASNDYTKPLQIYRKVEVPMSDSIGLVRGRPVRFIAPIGDAVFVAFDDKLMYNAGTGFTDCTDFSGADIPVVGYCTTPQASFFVSDQHVYRLEQLLNGGVYSYRLREIDVGGVSGLRCVQYDAGGNTLYLGGADGFIARGRYTDGAASVKLAQDIKCCDDDIYGQPFSTNRYINDVVFNAFCILDGKDPSVNQGKSQTNVLAATDRGLFRSDSKSFLNVNTAPALSEKTCVGAASLGDVVYFLASDGHVYRQSSAGDMSFEEYSGGVEFGSPAAIASHQSGLYIACAAGIYRYTQLGEQPVVELECPLPTSVSALAVATLFGDRIVFAASENKVYYYQEPRKIRSIQFPAGYQIKQVVPQPRKGRFGEFDVYVLAEPAAGGDSNISAAYIGFGREMRIDYGEINAVDPVDSDVDAVVCGGGCCYYAKNGILRNKTTGASANLGDMQVRQMCYLPDGNMLVLATNIGLYVLNASDFSRIDVISNLENSDNADIKYVSAYGNTLCFATGTGCYAAWIGPEGVQNIKYFGDNGSISALAAGDKSVYILGAGGILSSSMYQIYQIVGADDGDDDGSFMPSDAPVMDFPVMPFMEEVNDFAAVGLSGGVAYRLGYGDWNSSAVSVTFPDFPGREQVKPVSAFCKAGNNIFVATPQKIYKYECGSSGFDPGLMNSLTAKTIYSLPGVTRIVCTDDGARVYAQTEGGKIYKQAATQFTEVTSLGTGSKCLLKADREVLVLEWNATGSKVYIENSGSFSCVASGEFEKSIDDYADAQICYGVINDYSADEKCYLFLKLKKGPDIDTEVEVEVYAVENGTFGKVCEFQENSAAASKFSYISYAGLSSSFDEYTRQTIFGGEVGYHYDWPFIMRTDNLSGVLWLDFAAKPDITFTTPQQISGQTPIWLGQDDGEVYCVSAEGSKAVLQRVPSFESILTCDVDSTLAWQAGARYFFQAAGGGIRYQYDGVWRSCGDGMVLNQFGPAVIPDGPCYFLSEDGQLYESVSTPAHPVSFGPTVSAIQWPFQNMQEEPVRLVAGRVYAGFIGHDDPDQCNLYILWPSPSYTPSPASGGAVRADNSYNVYACCASFRGFPDGGVSTTNIVPLGDFLDELVVYEGGYLHIARVHDAHLVIDDSGTSIIPVVNTLPYTDFAVNFARDIPASVKSGGLRYITTGTGLSSFAEGTAGLALKVLSPTMKADGVDARSFCEIGQNAFLVATDAGVYRYQHLDGTPVVGRMSPGSGYNVAQITSYNFTGMADTYLMANTLDGYLYNSENARVWKKMFAPAPTPQLCAVYPQDSREWYFGTATGLYKSSYSYYEIDDIKKFTEDDLYALYAELVSSDISGMYEDKISEHELSPSYALGHVSSLMYDINTKLMGTDFDSFKSSGWQQRVNEYSAPEQVISNDLVFEQFWGANTDHGVTMSVENQFVTTPDARLTYLVRRWMSGITELYVQVPTTNTYYINHVSSTPGYNIDEGSELTAANVTQFGRDKTVFPHDPNQRGVYTTMKLAVSKDVFSVDQLIDVQACGNSLPLKIYRETVEDNGGGYDNFAAAQYFNSYIAPTTLLSTAVNDDNYIFEFACFGADEQVIRLQFIDQVNRFDSDWCRIIFHPNGGQYSDASLFIRQRMRLDGQPYALRRNEYRYPQDQKLFAGWTFGQGEVGRRPSDNPDTDTLIGFYTDRQQITSTEIEDKIGSLSTRQDITLYAVWITYQFSAADTTLLVQPQAGKALFRLGHADIADTPTAAKYGNKIIVKFEEVS